MRIAEPNAILISLPNWVGDAVMAQPAIEEIRRTFTSAHITLAARPAVAGLYEDEELADEVLPIGGRPLTFLRDLLLLRRNKFDCGVLLRNSFASALLARAARVDRVIGYPTDGRGFLLSSAIPFEPEYKTRHQVFYYLNIARRLASNRNDSDPVIACDSRSVAPRLRVHEDQKISARRWLAGKGLALDRPIIAINPGATNSRAKRWLSERFARTADLLAEEDGFQTIIVGASGDLEAALKTKLRMKSPGFCLAGETSIAELKAILSICSLVISNDTGAAHLSAALGVPTVAIFGPTEHFATKPLSKNAIVIRNEVECSPCMLRDCPIDHRCMTNIEVEDVLRESKALLAKTEAQSS
ncbi:MAG: lipopolysaccharide heptosyltransferase II [Blastocatellia bacterium AA13]|nr:MAG: lipopolysaccharide heptosyltransferase II [Blastocatellia bacterium AA13]